MITPMAHKGFFTSIGSSDFAARRVGEICQTVAAFAGLRYYTPTKRHLKSPDAFRRHQWIGIERLVIPERSSEAYTRPYKYRIRED